MSGGNWTKKRSASSKKDECLRIASTVTSLAGSFLGDVGTAINVINQPLSNGVRPGFKHSPFKNEVGALSGPTVEEKIRAHQGISPSPRPIESGVPSDEAQPTSFIKNMRGLHVNKIILICGVPSPNASRFSIYLQKGKSSDPTLVAMVLDVRFKWGNPVTYNLVVRNHKEGEWDNSLEERVAPYFPFKRDQAFEIIIMVDVDCYKVAVDNHHFIKFNHRVQPLSSIDTLRIEGDVKITTVQFQD